MVPKILLCFPILFLVCYQFFPESPWFLVHQNRLAEAEKSLRFYRNMKSKADVKAEEVFQLELTRIKDSHTASIVKQNSKKQQIITLKDFGEYKSIYMRWSSRVSEENQQWKQLFAACKPVVIGIMAFLILDFCGVLTMISYAGKIFSEAGTQFDPNEAVVVVGIIQLIGTYISTMTVDRVGRKILFSTSCMGTGACYCVLATYIYLSNQMDLSHIHWVPVLSFGGILFIASIGILPIPYVMLGEILPQKVCVKKFHLNAELPYPFVGLSTN